MDTRREKGVLKADFHLHTGEDPIDLVRHDAPTLIERAANAGFGALAITLHERQLVDPWLTEFARERGIVLLPGIERTIEGKHVLLINFPRAAVESVFTFRDLACLKARSNGLVIAPHPFFPGGSCLGRQLDAHPDLFDAVEWSYFWTHQINFNSRAARWARAHRKPIVGNTDMHDIRQLGRTYSVVRAEAHADAICAAVRDGHVEVSTEPVPVLELATVLGGMTARQTVLKNARQPVFGARKPRTAELAGSRDLTWRGSPGL
jgi:predicted metal-dependent phosphoesterase TrpH